MRSVLIAVLLVSGYGWAASPADVRTPPATPATDRADSPVSVPTRGQMLYENHCLRCHASLVYTRESRRAQSPEELRAQVARWTRHERVNWSDEDVAEVTRYLDTRYYHFSR